ncbi:MAG TPA: AgmX/PglI C-terminal domain-containing protein [Polyangiaceae bacterium]|nr:AgmX/PglI C-terminal domain-containing protein [Polyangiaceae bacterium]
MHRLLGALWLTACSCWSCGGSPHAQPAASAEPTQEAPSPAAHDSEEANSEAASAETATPQGGLGISGLTSEESIPIPSARAGGGPGGRLPASAIQAVIREHFDDLRRCYQAGLGRDASLTGKVIVRFVIGRDGTVTAKGAAPESTMPDAAVTACVLDEFAKLVFPQPEGGIVTVVYPIQFSSEPSK